MPPTLLDTPKGVSGKIDRTTNQFQSINGVAVPQSTPTTSTSTIPVDTLQKNQTPYDIPQQKSQTNTSLALSANNATSGITTDATFELPQNPAKDALSSKLDSLMTQASGLAKTEDKIGVDAGLAEKKQKATAVSNELDKMDKDYRDEIAAIKKNPEGKLEGALQADIADATDRYNNNRANVALTYKVLAGDYNDAAQLVEQKVAHLDKQFQSQIQLYQLAVSAVNNDLTESEKLKVQANIQQKQQERSATLDVYKLAVKNAADNGAPASVLTAIDQAASAPGASAASIMSAAGSYAKDPQVRLAEQKAARELSSGGPVSITNPAASPYGTALSVILGSSKFTAQQKASVIAAINNGEDPFTVIKNQAKNIMGQTEATNLTKLEVARDTLSDIGSQLQKFYAAGGSTSLISGNLEKVYNNLGNVKDPKLVNLATQIQANLQVYRNAISGTAYSAQEGKDIRSIFPGIDKSQTLNTAILSARKASFDSVIDATYRSSLGSTYNDLTAANKVAKPAAPEELKADLQPGEILVSREFPDGRHYVAITPNELWATDQKI